MEQNSVIIRIKKINIKLNEPELVISKEVTEKSTGSFYEESAKKQMLNFVCWDDYNGSIEDLRKKTLDEDSWDFGDGTCEILDNYFSNTFCQIIARDKIFYQNNWAVFNTGLLNKRCEPIYCILKGSKSNNSKLHFYNFLLKGEKSGGVTLADFKELPERVCYYNSFEELYFNPNLEIQIDYDHLIKNSDRIPKKVLRNIINGEVLDSNDKRMKLHDKLEIAMNILKKRIDWNYKTAIPFFYPRRKKIHFFLPICLNEYDKADNALVVSMHEGCYQGETIYPLDWAYKYARLICRPDNDWLNIERVKDIRNNK